MQIVGGVDIDRGIKRSDLTTSEVLCAVAIHGNEALDRLSERWPPKIARRAIEREYLACRLATRRLGGATCVLTLGGIESLASRLNELEGR